jgi:hypothetical protein
VKINLLSTLLLSLVSVTTSASAAENAFNPFVAEYSVLSSQCTYNGETVTENCDLGGVVILPRESEDIFELREKWLGGGDVGYPLNEIDVSEPFATETAKIEGDANSASWIHRLSLSDGRRLFEVREVKRNADGTYTYFFYHKEKPLFSPEWVVARTYSLQRKP